MAFNQRYFQPVGGNARGGSETKLEDGKNAPAHWNLGSTSDTFSTIITSNNGYFNTMRNVVNSWDIVKVWDSAASFSILQIANSLRSPSTANVSISGKTIKAS